MKASDLAQLCADIYTTTDGFSIYDCNGVYVGHCTVDNQDVFVFRGSANLQDWLDDFYCCPVKDSKLGIVHGGMYKGVPEAYLWIRNMLSMLPQPNDVILTGHSLGGAHARLIAGLFAADSLSVTTVMTFGSPKPGCNQLVQLVAKSGEHTSYRHDVDIVPELPPDIFGYLHTEAWTDIPLDPAQGAFVPAKDHSVTLYRDALLAWGL